MFASLTLFLARLLIGVACCLPIVHSPLAFAREPAPSSAVDEVRLAQLPPQVRETLALIRAGSRMPYPKDGSVFGNREAVLPRQARGYYTEYTVPTPGSRDRGARRIVAGGDPVGSNEFYYTADHYRSFQRIRE